MASANTYPIILVHGYTGWGRDELGKTGYKYWGGVEGDLQEQLRKQGYTVHTATVGPFSSNWDRACELFAQIRGGRVDYGAKHSAAHSHARFSKREFPGLYPQWGKIEADGTINKVHLIGHSMGGQTTRMLAQLLAKGSRGAPVEEDPASHELFAGGKDWVHSVTTVATPNQGARLADNMLATNANVVKNRIVKLFALLDMAGAKGDDFYDAKLDQWGISVKADSETLHAYLDRVSASPIFDPECKDLAAWSLSTDGAKEENAWVATLENVFYFSRSGHADISAYLSNDLRPWQAAHAYRQVP